MSYGTSSSEANAEVASAAPPTGPVRALRATALFSVLMLAAAGAHISRATPAEVSALRGATWDDKTDDSNAMTIDTKPGPMTWDDKTDDSNAMTIDTKPAAMTWDDKTDDSNAMTIDTKPLELGAQPGSKSSMKSAPGKKKGSLENRLEGEESSSTDTTEATETAQAPTNEFAGDDSTGERFAPPAQKLQQERFCISDDTCVDYSGTDYICVAGKCVPMGGQPSPIEPEELGEQPGSKSSMKSTPGKKKGSLENRLEGEESSSTEETTETEQAPTNEFAGDDSTGERFAPPAGAQALGAQPGSKSSMKSAPGKKKGSLENRLEGEESSSTDTTEATETAQAPTNEFAGDDSTGERFAPPAAGSA